MQESPRYQASSLEKSPKQILWEQRIGSLREEEGDQPIDENLREAIVALNVHGIHTIASCGGHVAEERHTGDSLYPWILISNYDRGSEGEDEVDIAVLHSKLKAFLIEFYNDRQTVEGNRLKISDIQYDEFTLSSEGDEDIHAGNKELTEKEKNDFVSKLPERQREMEDFGQFLKSKFFTNDQND